MEIIQGRHTYALSAAGFAARLAEYGAVAIDLGTGDGRYVQQCARSSPATLAIGVDACRENLRQVSRSAPPNALFVIANALALPDALAGVATRITINFPWGSLLRGLLDADDALLDGLRRLARPGTTLEVRLNSSALLEAGVTLAEGGPLVRRALHLAGYAVGTPVTLDATALRACPTTWAKRLGWGRDPQALELRAVWPQQWAQAAA